MLISYRLSFLFRDLYSILSKQRVVFTRFVFLLAWLHGKILRKRFVTLSVVILFEHFAKSRRHVIWMLIVSLFVLLFYYCSLQMKISFLAALCQYSTFRHWMYCTVPRALTHGSYFFKAVCVPNCQNGGLCVKPDQCACQSGWVGSRCSKGKLYPSEYRDSSHSVTH